MRDSNDSVPLRAQPAGQGGPRPTTLPTAPSPRRNPRPAATPPAAAPSAPPSTPPPAPTTATTGRASSSAREYRALGGHPRHAQVRRVSLARVRPTAHAQCAERPASNASGESGEPSTAWTSAGAVLLRTSSSRFDVLAQHVPHDTDVDAVAELPVGRRVRLGRRSRTSPAGPGAARLLAGDQPTLAWPDDRGLSDRHQARARRSARFARIPDGRRCMTVSQSRRASWACHSSFATRGGNASV